MKNWEAMVRVDDKDCYDCSPKGTTKSGSHANIVHMVAPAFDYISAKRYFETQGQLISNVKEVVWHQKEMVMVI